jgi:hypothetical protein
MNCQRPTIIETLVAGGRCTLGRAGTEAEPESFADTVAAMETAIGLAVRVGELPAETDCRAVAILGAATIAGLEMARWELGPDTDVLAAYEIFARGALSAVSNNDGRSEFAAWAS